MGSRFSIGVFLALLCALADLPAQVNKKATDGVVPYTVQQGAPRGSYRLDNFDSVNLYSGRLNVSVPLLTLGARGEAGYTVAARVSLPPWTPELELRSSPCSGQNPEASYNYLNKATAFWWTAHRARLGPGMVVYKRSGWQEETHAPSGGDPIPFYGQTYSHVVFLAPDGTEHALHENRTPAVFGWNASNYALPPADRYRQNFRSLDSPGMTFRSDTPLADAVTLSDMANEEVSLNLSGWLRFPDGLRYRVDLGKISFIEDRNGNRMVFTYESFQDPGTNQTIFTHRVTKATDSIGRETTFEYGVTDQIDGFTVIVDRIRYLGGATPSSLRKILIERKPVINQLVPGAIASTALFPGLADGGTNVIPHPVISRIVFDNSTRYTFYYNEFGEVARTVLPTGGRVDYAHGPGVAAGDGVFGGGRILSNYGIDYLGGGSQCVPRPTGSPMWQPLIYRRLLTRSVFPSEAATVPEKVSQHLSQESVLSGVCFYGGTSTCSYRNLNLSFPGYLETRETALNNLAAPDKVHRKFFHPGNPFAEGLANGPLDRLLKEKSTANPAAIAAPDPFDGKELRSETGSGLSAAFAPLQRSESVYAQLADGSVRPCQERQTLINGAASKSSVRSLQYDALPAGGDNQLVDPSNAPLNGALPVRFSSLTDAYDYDWDSGPAFGTCPAPPGNYLRRTRYEYQANVSPAYREWESHLLQLPSFVAVYGPGNVQASEAVYAYDQTSRLSRGSVVNHVLPPVGRRRGNLTSLTQRIDASTVATLQREYDELGHIVAEIDPRLARTDYLYDEANYDFAVSGTYGFLTAIDRPSVGAGLARQRTARRLNYRTGAVTRMTAPNGTVTNYDYQDPLDRLTLAERAVGSPVGNLVTRYQYVDVPGQFKVTSLGDRYAANDQGRLNAVCYDGFGQDTRSTLLGAGGGVLTGKLYDGFNRVSRTYNPQVAAADCTSAALAGPGTVLAYDALDRVRQSTSPGGSVTEFTYALNETTVKDPAQKYRRTARDPLGRVASVTEDAQGGGANLVTTYSYDGEGRLTYVNQGAQTRSFTYDRLGRLLTANNPESGQITYTYDLNGNLVSRRDGRNALTCYGIVSGSNCDGTTGYDALNRPQRKQSVNPAGSGVVEKVIYCYDGKVKAGESCGGGEVALQRGQLTSVGNGNSDTDYTYDAVGRLAQSVQRTGGLAAMTFAYGYYRSDLRGEILYPSGRRVVTCADGLLRPVWVSAVKTMADCTAGVAPLDSEIYVKEIQYAPHGAVAQLKLGNGHIESTGHNADLQPTLLRLGGYAGAGAACGHVGDEWCLALSYGTGLVNNGNVTAQDIFARKSDGTHLALRQSYSYDALNRLTEFSETVQAGGTGTWSELNQYDRYGNRWATSTIAQAATTPAQQAWISTATNRVVQSLAGGLTYDAAGNLTAHPQVSNGAAMTYDAENRLTGFGAGATYTYDGEGRRVKRSVNGTVTYYVYDGTGALAAEYGGGSPAVGRRYVTVDHLGSTRVTTDGTGTVRSRCDYLPFGDQILAISSQGNRNLIPEYACAESDVTVKFTGKERDGETGLDYFGARYMSSAQGRFTSPDKPFADQTPFDPQSWNLYSYTRNNPLKYVDRDGEAIETAWDALNIGIGVKSFVDNVRSGNYVSATVDAVGVVIDSAAAAVPFIPGGAGTLIKAGRLAGKADDIVDGVRALSHADDAADAGKTTLNLAEGTVGELRKAGKSDAHHVIQDAAVRDLPGYNSSKAPGVQLPGPASKPGTPHNATRSVQQQRGGGTYAAERRIGYKALRKAGATRDQARQQIKRADEYFDSIGATGDTATRIPRDRR